MWKSDISEVLSAGDEFDSFIDGLGPKMQSVVHRSGAVHAKSHHRYTNRTYNLQGSTDAFLTKDSPNEVQVDLAATAEYAGAVAALGYLDMGDSASVAENALDGFFDSHG